MNDKLLKWIVVLSSTLAVIYPQWIHFSNTPLGSASLSAVLFPAFGLFAATLLWLHAISGVFEDWLREKFDFDFFVHWSSVMILIAILLHPLLLLTLINFDIGLLFSSNPLAISLGLVGLILLLTYDIGKAMKKYKFFTRHWNAILVVSTIGFLLTFLHALMLGSDLQTGPMRALWFFYGITALLATIYTYGIKKFIKQK